MFRLKSIIDNKFFFITIPSLLTILIPFFLITGPFLPDLAVSLCAILFIINTIYNPFKKFKDFYKSKFFLIFIIFWMTAVASSLFSKHILFSLETSFFYIRFGFFVLSVWFLLRNNPKIINLFFYMLFFCFVILIADGFLQFFLGKNLFGWKIISNRISSFFKEELIMGSYISRLLPLFLALFIFLKKEINNFFKYSFIIIFVLSEVLIFLSGERASFFFLNLSALFILVLSNNYKKMRIGMLSSAFVIMCAITLVNSEYKFRMFDTTLNQIKVSNAFNKNDFNKDYYVFTSQHENIYKSAILMFKENPIIGIGPRLFRLYCNKKEFLISSDSCTVHPHNNYIQLLAELGIIGFAQISLLFLILVFFSVKHFFLKIKKRTFIFNDYQISLLSGFLITLWPIVPTGNFFGNWVSIIYYLPLGFFLFSFDKKIFLKKKKI
jgi:hypothetical protein